VSYEHSWEPWTELDGWQAEVIHFHGVNGRWRALDMADLGLPEEWWQGNGDTYGPGALSPDGRWWALQSGAGALVLEIATGEIRLLRVPGGRSVTDAIWAPNSLTFTVYNRRHGGTFEFKVRTGERRHLRVAFIGRFGISYTPTSRTYSWSSPRPGTTNAHYLSHTDGAPEERFLTVQVPSFGIVFLSAITGNKILLTTPKARVASRTGDDVAISGFTLLDRQTQKPLAILRERPRINSEVASPSYRTATSLSPATVNCRYGAPTNRPSTG